MNDEAIDPRPDPKKFRFSMLEGKSPEERRAILDAVRERAEEEATARRGRPLQPGDIGVSKGTMPSIYYLMRQRSDGSWERVPDDELPRYDDSEEERP